MLRMSIKLACAFALLLAAAAVFAGCKPKEAKPPAAPPVASAPNPAPGQGTLSQPGEPTAETPPAPAAPEQGTSVASDTVFSCNGVSLGLPFAEIQAKYVKNNFKKEQWVVPEDTGMINVMPGIGGKSGTPSPGGQLETMQFFFKGGKLVGYFHAKSQPKADEFGAWVKREGAQLPPPGQVLPDFAKDVDICSSFTALDPKAQNAIWFNDSAQTLLGAHFQPDTMIAEVLVDAKQFKEVMAQISKAPPAKGPGQAPPPPATQ